MFVLAVRAQGSSQSINAFCKSGHRKFMQLIELKEFTA